MVLFRTVAASVRGVWLRMLVRRDAERLPVSAFFPQVREEQRKAAADSVNFPCVLKILPNCVFNKKDPIIVGVEIVSGIARVGTVLCVPSQGFIDLGRIASLEHNHKSVDKATKGQSVAMKIQPQIALESSRAYGRHFDHKDELVSRVTRRSIDLLKARLGTLSSAGCLSVPAACRRRGLRCVLGERGSSGVDDLVVALCRVFSQDHFRDELAKEDWILLAQLKKKQEIHYSEVI